MRAVQIQLDKWHWWMQCVCHSVYRARTWMRHEAGKDALLLILLLTLVEPLGCLGHCQFPAPVSSGSSAAHLHHRAMSHNNAVLIPAPAQHDPGQQPTHTALLHETLVNSSLSSDTGPHVSQTACAMLTGQNPLPAPPGDSSVSPHEHLAILPVLIILLLAALVQLVPNVPDPPPQFFSMRPMRPPILHAA